MARTHEALLRAEKEYQEELLGSLPTVSSQERPSQIRQAANNSKGMQNYEDLKTNLFSRYADGAIKRILFNGTHHGGGCSTTAVNFAITVAKDSGFKVLLVDVNLRTPALHEIFKIDGARGLTDLTEKGQEIVALIKKVGPGELSVLTCGGKYSVPLSLFESKRFDQFLKTMDEQFDYIILDAPPVPRFPECRILCSKVDGVILVLDAGSVRRQVALSAKKQLEEAGGKLLGVVLNRRKHYIPEWIYKRV